MLSMVAIWMAFNMIGIIMMIIMIDLPGKGLLGKGVINSIQSAVLRWMTMGAVATNLRVQHSHYEPDGQGGWELKKASPVGGGKSNKNFKALLYLYLFSLLSICFILGLIFPKNIKELFTGQLGVPMSNMSNLPGGMNSNMTQFTDFIHSRHKPELHSLTISKDHNEYIKDLNSRQKTINKGNITLNEYVKNDDDLVKTDKRNVLVSSASFENDYSDQKQTKWFGDAANNYIPDSERATIPSNTKPFLCNKKTEAGNYGACN